MSMLSLDEQMNKYLEVLEHDLKWGRHIDYVQFLTFRNYIALMIKGTHHRPYNYTSCSSATESD